MKKLIEQIIYEDLKEKANIPIYLEHAPGVNDDAYLIIEKTGSNKIEGLARATFAVQSYGKTITDAAELNAKIKNIMINLSTWDKNILEVDLNSDYNYTDTEQKLYRYQAVFDITYYNTELEF